MGFDGSVTKWTALNTGGAGLEPFNMTVFNDALWFDGATPANGFQLYKLGNDGSVRKWTNIGSNLDPFDSIIFNNALWFSGANAGQQQLYKLGNDGSVTQWTANPGGGLDPSDMSVFNGALWFEGATPANGGQLFKLGNDGSVTQWTAIGSALDPLQMTVFNNALCGAGDRSTAFCKQLAARGGLSNTSRDTLPRWRLMLPTRRLSVCDVARTRIVRWPAAVGSSQMAGARRRPGQSSRRKRATRENP